MADELKQQLLQKLDTLDQMPSIPAALFPLLRYLEQPLDSLDVQQVVDMISQDKSLAAQCLRMANSSLFGRREGVENIRSAVVALGLQRIRDVALSCSILQLMPATAGVDPTVFWEHSLGCALVCRHFARRIGFGDPSKAYLGGLLHDLGVIVNLWMFPQEFCSALSTASEQHIPLHESEQANLGFTHCDSGYLLAKKWNIQEDLAGVILHHHKVDQSESNPALAALVTLSDLLCRMGNLGHGFVEERQVNVLDETAFEILVQHHPPLAEFDWARLTFELESYLDEVHEIVNAIYRPQ
jgi:HD-like signal output (HDOD) protein